MTDRDAVQELRERAAELERSAKALEAARVERAAALPPEAAPATPPAAAGEPSPAAAEAPAVPAAIAQAVPGVPRPGQRLDSAGYDALLRNPDDNYAALAAYEAAPGGSEEIKRVEREHSKGRRA